ncbi:MAG: hypothetical protein RLN90_13875 [Balneolaceae bacterium]
MIISTSITAQDEPYSFTFAPDLWYNDVDGIRVGIRVLGEVEGTFKDGPHRLDAGFWLGTWFPDNPISYYLSFIEPIKAISDFGNEGSIQLISSIRTGYSQHKFQFNKRWQPGFDEFNYLEFNTFISAEKLTEIDYRPFPSVWQTETKTILGTQLLLSRPLDSGFFIALFDLKSNINDQSGRFTVGTLEMNQRFDISEKFRFNIRGYAGIGSENIANEYRFLASMASAQTWLNKGISRAKGTIAQPWLEAGSFQVGGGANLRGYLNRDIDLLSSGANPSSETIIALNLALEFPNFLDSRLKNVSIVGDLVSLSSYLFFDIGRQDFISPTTTVGNTSTNTPILADAGTGFQLSINIPDYLGKDRGIFIRYDIPFWLSDPSAGESNFSFRQLIGIGAIISF